MNLSTQRRFWNKVQTPEDAALPAACWLWTGAKDEKGYGRFNAEGKNVKAHRFAFRLLSGPIPSGCELHHECRRRACVNPAHIHALTREVHNTLTKSIPALRGRRRECCKRGHPLTPPNVYTTPSGKRCCETCKKARQAAYNQAARESRRAGR